MGLSTQVQNAVCPNSLVQVGSILSSCTLLLLEGIQLMGKQIAGWHS